MNRRSFLRTGFAATAGLALSGLGAAPTRRVKAGVQLYSVRKLCERDFPGTLRALKAMGYEGVQCGGFFGRTAKELNTLFKDHGLAAAGMQMQADRIIKPENIAESVTFASELGAPYLFVPWFDAKTADGWKRFAEQMSVAAQAFKAAGSVWATTITSMSSATADGVCKWDILYQNASPDVLQQLDLGHCLLAGESPAFWLKKYPNRNPAVHVKAASKTTGVIGTDGADWEKVFAACEADVTEWYVVEAEVRPDTLDDVRDCLAYMKKLGRA